MSGQVEDKGMVLTVRDRMRREVADEVMREESKVCLGEKGEEGQVAGESLQEERPLD
jgi:hypothetical protein